MKRIAEVEERFVTWLDKYAYSCLRVSIGIIYVAFGGLKFFPEYSPAEQLAADTICLITFDVLSGASACTVLAILETLLGAALIVNYRPKIVIIFTMWHMCCTFLPVVLLPHYAFNSDPFSFSLVGQYIFKNLIILSALLVLYRHASTAEKESSAASSAE